MTIQLISTWNKFCWLKKKWDNVHTTFLMSGDSGECSRRRRIHLKYSGPNKAPIRSSQVHLLSSKWLILNSIYWIVIWIFKIRTPNSYIRTIIRLKSIELRWCLAWRSRMSAHLIYFPERLCFLTFTLLSSSHVQLKIRLELTKSSQRNRWDINIMHQ